MFLCICGGVYVCQYMSVTVTVCLSRCVCLFVSGLWVSAFVSLSLCVSAYLCVCVHICVCLCVSVCLTALTGVYVCACACACF